MDTNVKNTLVKVWIIQQWNNEFALAKNKDFLTFQGHRKMPERLGPKKFPGLKWVDIDPFGL